MNSHVFVATTGCAGSTLFMAIFTKLGMDTGYGFIPPSIHVEGHKAFGGGYEINMNGYIGVQNHLGGFPYILKSSKICSQMMDRAERFDYKIDHVYCLFRDPWRASVKERVTRYEHNAEKGEMVWQRLMSLPNRRERLKRADRRLQRRFLSLCLTVAKHDIPNTLLVYPHCMVDLPTTYKKLEFLMTKYSISYDRFKEACDELIDQDVLDIALRYVPK